MDNTSLLKWLVFLAIQLFESTQICEVTSPHVVYCTGFYDAEEFRDAAREGASEIREFIIYESNMNYITSEIFEDLKHLKVLNVSGSGLHFPSLLFEKIPYLEVLIIDGCWISSDDSRLFSEMTSLKKLHITKSDFEYSFSSYVFNNLSSLVTLELNNDYMDDAEFEAFRNKPGLSFLTYLSLKNNWIRNLRNNRFSAMSKLEDLRLDNNKIVTVAVHALAGLSSLRNLNLSQNLIEYLPDGLFEDTPNLRELDLHQNKVEYLYFSTFEGLSKLNALYLQLNNLKYISSEAFGVFKKGSSLKKLYLFENNVNGLYKDTFADLDCLNELLLDDQNLLIEERGIVDNITKELILPFKK